MSDNQKEYEEAANEYAATFFQLSTGPGYQACVKDFLAGASFAEKENDKFILQLKEHIERQQNSAEILANAVKSRDKEIEQLQEEKQGLKRDWDEALTELKSMDEFVKELRQENQRLKEAMKEIVRRSFQALNDVYEECHCEEQNLIKSAGKYSDKVREYKDFAHKHIEP